MFALMFPGMEWIPLMVLTTTVGLLSGTAATVAAAVNIRSSFGRWTAGLACLVGIAMPLLLLAVIGGELHPAGYICVALPLLPGLVALAMLLPNPGVPQETEWPRAVRIFVAIVVAVTVLFTLVIFIAMGADGFL